MGELTNDKRTLLRATSLVRGISLTQIHALGLYRPKETLQSLLSNGWLTPDPVVNPHDPTPRYFLSDRARRWREKFGNGTVR